jgi:hypothetical protein
MRLFELAINENVNWVLPNFEEEWGEVAEAFDATGARYRIHFPDKETWFAKAKQGNMQEAKPEWNVENTDAFEGTPWDAFDKDKVKRVRQMFKSGKSIQLPIILHDSRGYILIGGNTRLSMAVDAGVQPMAWVIDLVNVKEEAAGVGKITKQNMTADVGPNQDKIEQNKFFAKEFYPWWSK